MTSTKVKVKVTELPKLGKLHFSAYLLCHFRVELKTDGWCDSIGLWTWSTACRSPIFEFPSRKGITRVQTSQNVDISRHSNDHIFWYCVMLQSHGWVRWYSYTYCDLIQGQGQGHGPFELPTVAHNCTFLGLSPPPLSRGAQTDG